MTLDLTTIPDVDAGNEPGATGKKLEPTEALTGLGALAKRRTVLRGVALAGASIGASALTWGQAGTPTAHAETSPTGLTGWDRNDCRDAYPNGYNEMRDNTGIYTNEPGACFGGSYVGSTLCDSTGWHRADSQRISWSRTNSYRPISTACGATTTKNAWRWTVNGVTYRCSDGIMSVKYFGSTWYTYLTICRARV